MMPALVPGNRLTLLRCGEEYFPALMAAIDAAERSVHLETYIFAADRTGYALAAALSRASRRGVSVRLLVDGFGGGDFRTRLMPQLLADGVGVKLFRPDFFRPDLHGWRAWRLGPLRRLHRKLAVVDEKLAFVGGINIVDDMDLPAPVAGPRLDFAVRVEGPLVAAVTHALERLWQNVVPGDGRIRASPRGPRLNPPPPAGEDAAALVLRDNIRHRRDIELAYLEAIRGATREIILASAYFLPGSRFRRALIEAASRGVSVRLLVEGRAEYRLQYYATQFLYSALLEGGVRVFEYKRSFLHAKAAVIDGQWATVGSSNIDPFSLFFAQEANLVTRAPAFASALRAALADALDHGSEELNAGAWQRSGLAVRLLRFASYQTIRMLLGVFGFEPSDPPPPPPGRHVLPPVLPDPPKPAASGE